MTWMINELKFIFNSAKYAGQIWFIFENSQYTNIQDIIVKRNHETSIPYASPTTPKLENHRRKIIPKVILMGAAQFASLTREATTSKNSSRKATKQSFQGELPIRDSPK
jgi:hypothetical protein